MKLFILYIIIITTPLLGYTQNKGVNRIYPIGEISVLHSVIKTDHSVLVGGSSYYERGPGSKDLLIGKLNSNGDTLGLHIYGSAHHGDKAHKVVQMRNKDLLLIGQMGQPDSIGELLSNAYVMRADSTGRVLWEHEIDSGGGDIAYTGGETPDGGVFIAGVLKQTVNWANPTAFWAKFSAEGEREYFRTYSHPAAFYAGVALPDGNFVVGGRSANPQDTGYYLLKLDSTGNIIKRFSSKPWASGRIYDMELLNDGNIVVTGLWGGDVLVAKFHEAGQMLWHKRYGGSAADYGYGMDKCRDGGFIIAGSKKYEAWLLKTDSLGDTLWSKTFTTRDGGIEARDVIQTDSGYIMVGHLGNARGIFIRTDSLGNAPRFATIAVTKKSSENQTPDVNIYPNPASDFMHFSYKYLHRQNTSFNIEIYNLLGEKVLTQKVNPKDNRIDVSSLPKGEYVTFVKVDDHVFTKKIIIR